LSTLSDIAVRVQSGQKYKFAVQPIGTRCRQVGGVFVVTHREETEAGDGMHQFLSVGHADDLSLWRDEIPDFTCFDSHQANCIAVLYEPDYQNRQRIVQDIRESFAFLCE